MRPQGYPTFLTIFLVAVSVSVATANEELYLPQSAFPQVVELWQNDRAADALALLERHTSRANNDQPVEVLVLRAALLSDIGQPKESEALWSHVIERVVWMRTFSRRALVKSLTSRGEPEQAEPILTELTQSDATRHLDVALLVANAFQRSGKPDKAARIYRLILRRQQRSALADAARLGLARSLEFSGNQDAALNQLREAKLLHTQIDAFLTATSEERRLASAQRQDIAPFEEDEYRTLVRRIRSNSRFEPALNLINEWHAAHASTARPDRIESERIATLYAQRENDKAVLASQRFYERFPKSTLTPSIRLTEFRLAVRMGNTNRAREVGINLWQGHVPGATNAQRRSAAQLLAAYLVAIGDVGGGLNLYRELFRTTRSANNQRSLLWQAGIAALRDGQYERALTNLRGLMRRRPSGELVPAGLYWLGVAEANADHTTAVKTFRTVATQYPYHYYGIRAREQLNQLTNGLDDVANIRPLNFPALEVNPATRKRAQYKAAMLLARAGLVGEATSYLQRLLETRRGDRGLALLTARASAKAADYASVARILVNHFGTYMQRPARGLPNDFWQLVYPRPFWGAVDAAARTHGVDPVLLLSLMRQESRFDPKARSPVGAIGLFQIMPYTAEALAQSAGVSEAIDSELDEKILMQPSVNSAIAARLMGNLFEMFDAETAPVIASYNAGEDVVGRWWSSARELSDDFFVDTIPYAETRRFVREVLANYAAYRRVYED